LPYPGADQADLARGETCAWRCTQIIRLSIVDYGVELIVGPLYRALRSTAPGLDLAVLPWTGADRALDALAEGAIDLAVSVVAPGAGPALALIDA
jgi:hypothetical protein